MPVGAERLLNRLDPVVAMVVGSGGLVMGLMAPFEIRSPLALAVLIVAAIALCQAPAHGGGGGPAARPPAKAAWLRDSFRSGPKSSNTRQQTADAASPAARWRQPSSGGIADPRS